MVAGEEEVVIKLQELEEKREGLDRAGEGITSVAGVKVVADMNEATLPASTDSAEDELERSSSGGC